MKKRKRNRRHNDHQPISDVLKNFVQQNNLEKGINEVQVIDAWKKIMGPAIENYTTNIMFKNETLYVQLSSSVLRQELSYGTSKIISNLNEELRTDLIQKLVLR